MDDILKINMQSGMIDCAICGDPDDHRWGVPVYNGDVVSNDFVPPDERHAGGVAVCRECYRAHEEGRVRVFDACYQRRGPMGVNLVNGAGI